MTKLVHLSGSNHITSELFAESPDTFTVAGIVDITLEGDKPRHAVQLKELDGKTWVPAFTVLKALGSKEIWGREISNWIGQRLTLYRDPNVKIGKEVVGGIRVSHVTGISEPRTVKVKGAMNRPVSYTFQPLEDTPSVITQQDWQELNQAATDWGMENVPDWISAQLGRQLQGWQEITVTELDKLFRALNTDD